MMLTIYPQKRKKKSTSDNIGNNTKKEEVQEPKQDKDSPKKGNEQSPTQKLSEEFEEKITKGGRVKKHTARKSMDAALMFTYNNAQSKSTDTKTTKSPKSTDGQNNDADDNDTNTTSPVSSPQTKEDNSKPKKRKNIR